MKKTLKTIWKYTLKISSFSLLAIASYISLVLGHTGKSNAMMRPPQIGQAQQEVLDSVQNSNANQKRRKRHDLRIKGSYSHSRSSSPYQIPKGLLTARTLTGTPRDSLGIPSSCKSQRDFLTNWACLANPLSWSLHSEKGDFLRSSMLRDLNAAEFNIDREIDAYFTTKLVLEKGKNRKTQLKEIEEKFNATYLGLRLVVESQLRKAVQETLEKTKGNAPDRKVAIERATVMREFTQKALNSHKWPDWNPIKRDFNPKDRAKAAQLLMDRLHIRALRSYVESADLICVRLGKTRNGKSYKITGITLVGFPQDREIIHLDDVSLNESNKSAPPITANYC